MTDQIEHRLPVELLEKSIQNGSEYGWRKNDFLDVVEAARKLEMAIEGGLVQYVFEEGTCELYWLHYFTDEFKKGENWVDYCNRTAKECAERFNKIVREKDIKKDAINSFELAKQKADEGIDIDKHQIFIISFEDKDKMPVFPVAKEKEKKERRDRDFRRDKDARKNREPRKEGDQRKDKDPSKKRRR
ncbi:hypothetical protein [Flavobacterium caeni]|uniref:Uncharacterized protein n=1 Tax=Flavobacterium caeni TaxID=490189 RepID=A0A1G5IVE3_9FLAO|nr:hypothetical protein [Flavobacterium caeni]SCY79408.1 hypothetical protein SAMN02927903_02388 [Flavobacterium caeni]